MTSGSRKWGSCEACGGTIESRGRRAGRNRLRCGQCGKRAGSVPIETIPADPVAIRPDYDAPENRDLKGVSSYVTVEGPDGALRGQWILSRRYGGLRGRALEAAVLADVAAELPERMPAREGRITPPRPRDLDDDLLAVYPAGDPHFGMLAWGEESGADFDLKIGTENYMAAMDRLIGGEPRASHALIALLGDTFHADNQTNQTPKSKNQLDVDTRYAKIFRAVLRTIVHAIDTALATHRHVTVWSLRGNHDEHSAYVLAVALDAYYRQEPRVTVDLTPSRFFWLRFGKCMLGGTHGDTVKPPQLESIMASYRPGDWGETTHRHWLTGHIHTSQRHEYRGCVVETFRTLAAADAYAASHGYLSRRDAHRIVFHREWGEVARSIVNVDYLEQVTK